MLRAADGVDEEECAEATTRMVEHFFLFFRVNTLWKIKFPTNFFEHSSFIMEHGKLKILSRWYHRDIIH